MAFCLKCGTSIAIVFLVSLAAYGGPTPTVMTDLGAVQGVERNGVLEFRGMPYAAAPIGDLRWSLPQPAKRWAGVRDASRFGSACPQQARFNLTEASDDEDCLSLNVSVPSNLVPGEKLPVFIWIHGGAFVGGSSNLYRLDKLAREGGMLVVSVNYRLGILGFMSHPAFANAAGYNGNYGLEDQRAALAWVQRNIAAFGGDRNNVTVAGESAGADSVCMHLNSPERVTGLFQKAVIQSAGCFQALKTVSQAERTGLAVTKPLGCTQNASALQCLRSKPLSELLKAQGDYAAANPLDITPFGPVVGTVAEPNTTIPRSSQVAAESGKLVKVPLIYGGTRDELRLYVGYWVQEGKPVTTENYPDWVKNLYGAANSNAIVAEYPPGISPPKTLGSLMSDYMPSIPINNCLYLRTADAFAQHMPIYQFEFADNNAPVLGIGIALPDPGFELGAVHSSELNYLFPNLSNTSKINAPNLPPASQILANQMVAYWASFTHTGAPAVPGLPAWPLYKGGASVMLLDPGRVQAYDANVQHRCAFWKKLYPAAL